MSASRRGKLTRSAFNQAYDRFVRPGGFHELNSYYERSRERYYLTLRYLADLDLCEPAKLLDVGGGQFAILASKLFGDDGTVGDIGDAYRAPADAAGVNFTVCNLLDDDPPSFKGAFDVIVLAEVVEHLPVPPYVILSKVRTWLKPGGLLLLTTPNLFRLRNLVRMALGRDPFDIFRMPRDDVRFLATAMLLQKETGGNLAAILDKTGMVARERARLRGQLRIYTAQGRVTGWVLCLMPFIMFGLLSTVNWQLEKTLFTEPNGRLLVYVALGLMLLGIIAIRKIIDVKV